MQPIVVVSLFDGMACGLQALKQAGVPVKEYYAFEIDKYAMEVAKRNHPEIIHCGSVVGADFRNIVGSGKIDLLIGGSPCQGFSFAGKQLAFDDPRSKLFFEFVRAKDEMNPKKFLLENVRMKKQFVEKISELLGEEPLLANSALVSAQNRQRFYWCNWKISKPSDQEIMLEDIIEEGVVDRNKSLCLTAGYKDKFCVKRYFSKSIHQAIFALTETRTEEAKKIRKEYREKYGKDFSPRRAKELKPRTDGKMNCLTATYSYKEHTLVDEKINYRRLSVTECERLQTLPDGYTKGVSDPQRYKMIGNGWTVSMIQHFFEELYFPF